MKALTALAAALAVSMTISAAYAQENTQSKPNGPSLIDIFRGRAELAKDKDEKPGLKVAVAKAAKAKAARLDGRYGAIIARHAQANGVPAYLAQAVVRVESNFRPNARGSAGEVGLMQIKPATARMLGYSGSIKGLFDPETNIRFGMKYLGQAHKLGGGDTCGTILRYNAGHGAKRMNPVSSAYCSKVKKLIASG